MLLMEVTTSSAVTLLSLRAVTTYSSDHMRIKWQLVTVTA